MWGSFYDNLNKFMAAAQKRKEIAGMVSTFLPAVPQQFVDVDREKVLKQGVLLSDVYRTIQTFMGGLFVNYFNRFGRQWQVYVEAEGEYRASLDSLSNFYVRNNKNAMVPLSSLVRYEPRAGPAGRTLRSLGPRRDHAADRGVGRRRDGETRSPRLE